MSYRIIKKTGWYGEENDGIHQYQWSSELSTIQIEGDITKYNFISIVAGSSLANRHIKIEYEDNSTYDFLTENCWTTYEIPLRNSRYIIIHSEIISVDGDNRPLGLQIGDIILHTNSIYSYTIENLKSKWIDIIYNLYTTERSKIKIKFKNTIREFLVMGGGFRSLSFEINSEDIENNNISFEILKCIGDNIIINSIINRENYYDYMGLKSSKYYDESSRINEELCKKITKTVPFSFQWFVNWRCNFQCNYCWQTISKEIYRNTELNKIPWQQWVETFNYYKPNELSITGGEPTLYADLPEVINGLHPDISISMTTNLGPAFNLEKWKSLVKRNRIWDMFFSFHPTQWKNIDDFYEKVEKYIEFYKPGYCGIEMVESPQNLELIDVENLKQWCFDRKLNCKIDPYFSPTQYISLQHNIVPSDKIRLNMVNTSYENHISKVEIDKSYTPQYCSAGWKKINLDYKGNVFTCMSAVDRGKLFGEHSMPHYSSLGNIFDPNFRLRDRPILCWETYRCSHCDFYKLKPVWNSFTTKIDITLPIPS